MQDASGEGAVGLLVARDVEFGELSEALDVSQKDPRSQLQCQHRLRLVHQRSLRPMVILCRHPSQNSLVSKHNKEHEMIGHI